MNNMSIPASVTVFDMNTIEARDWFDLIERQNKCKEEDLPGIEEQTDEDKQYFYAVNTQAFFFGGGSEAVYGAGNYVFSGSKSDVENINISNTTIEKLSFFKIILLSHIYLPLMESKFVLEEEKMDALVQSGGAYEYAQKEMFVQAEIMKKKAERVVLKHFTGWTGLIKRICSALYNFFQFSHNFSQQTGIVWPGNTSSFALKLADKFHSFGKDFVNEAYTKNREVLITELGLTLTASEELSDADLIKKTKIRALRLHPDKNLNDPDATDNFQKFQALDNDFKKLSVLKATF